MTDDQKTKFLGWALALIVGAGLGCLIVVLSIIGWAVAHSGFF